MLPAPTPACRGSLASFSSHRTHFRARRSSFRARRRSPLSVEAFRRTHCRCLFILHNRGEALPYLCPSTTKPCLVSYCCQRFTRPSKPFQASAIFSPCLIRQLRSAHIMTAPHVYTVFLPAFDVKTQKLKK